MPTQPVLTAIDAVSIDQRTLLDNASPILTGNADPNSTVHITYSNSPHYLDVSDSIFPPVGTTFNAAVVTNDAGMWSFQSPKLPDTFHFFAVSASSYPTLTGNNDIGVFTFSTDTTKPVVAGISFGPLAFPEAQPGRLYASVGFNDNFHTDNEDAVAPVTNVDASDFILTTTGFTEARIGTIVQHRLSYTYDVQILTNPGNGTVQLTVRSDSDITDFAGNPLAAGLSSAVLTVINDPPPVATITADGGESNHLIHYTVGFSKPVTGFGAGDLGFVANGITDAAVQSVQQSDGTHYDIIVSTGTGNGSLALAIKASQADIRDDQGTKLDTDAVGPAYVNLAPVAAGIEVAAIVLHAATGNVLSSALNVDDPTTVTGIRVADPDGVSSSTLTSAVGAAPGVVQGRHGYLSVTQDGSYTYLASDASDIPTGSTLQDVFEYTITDSRGGASTGRLDFDVSRAGSSSSAPLAQAGNAFAVDGSLGPQSFIGTGVANFITTATAAGTGSVFVDLALGYVAVGGQVDALLKNINGVQLGADPSTVLGLTSGTDLIYGGKGAVEFYGQGATNVIQGGTGVNAIVGGTGSAIFYGNGGQDTMLGGTGSNFMRAGSTAQSTDVFYGHGGADYVYGGAGTTTLVGSTGYEQLTGSTTGAGLNVLYGGSGTDVFDGGSGTNLFYEGSGKDAFAGTTGTDLIYGGSGQSAVYGGAGTTVVTTGSGNQYVQAGSGHLFFNDTAAGLHAGRYDQIDNFAGSGGADLYLPTAVQGATSFVAQNGGTAVVTALDGGSATLFASGADLANVQVHTHFTLA